jgi:hypothetical protein
MTSENQTKIENLAESITSALNTFSTKEVENTLIDRIGRDHRTLQQAFTRLCLKWIEHCASSGYPIDPRNEQSHLVSKDLLEGFFLKKGEEDFKPSDYLRTI